MSVTVSPEEQQDRPSGMLEVTPSLVDDVCELVEAGERGMVLNIAADLHAPDLARLLTHLPFEAAWELFHWLPVEDAGEVLAEIEGPLRADLLEDARPERVTEIIDELDSDDAADVLAELPDDLARQILTGLEDAADVQTLLGYDEDTAGGIMGTELVAVPESWTVEEATEEVRRNAETVEQIYAVFVVDPQDRLVGMLSLKTLLLSQARSVVSDLMDREYHWVSPDVDQEEVGRIMQHYDLVSLPVVNASGRLLGRITIDDVVDVIREEAEEDIQRMSGIATGNEELDASVFLVSRGRLPWLLLGLVGTIMAGFVVTQFEASLAEAVVLASFMPIMTAMAGNAAIQSSAITVQGLASGRLWTGDAFGRLGKELAVAFVNGVALAFTLAVFVSLIGFGGGNSIHLALVVSLSLFIIILLATTNGALVPVLLARMGVDPAVAMGPFVTTSNDILGLTVYFLIATSLYL
jgi:magnesium transporter